MLTLVCSLSRPGDQHDIAEWEAEHSQNIQDTQTVRLDLRVVKEVVLPVQPWVAEHWLGWVGLCSDWVGELRQADLNQWVVDQSYHLHQVLPLCEETGERVL